ncbi:MAG TPA: hypothetical protein VKN18_25570 [Blastocatellia bacterium]|nr:hypothetical protein [Blastocatellia bacterium]
MDDLHQTVDQEGEGSKPYFHNNSAATLEEVLDHYDAMFRRAARLNPPPTYRRLFRPTALSWIGGSSLRMSAPRCWRTSGSCRTAKTDCRYRSGYNQLCSHDIRIDRARSTWTEGVLCASVAFIFKLRDSDVKFIACDMPEANTLTIGLLWQPYSKQ